MYAEHTPVTVNIALAALKLEAGAVGVVVHVHRSGLAYEVEFMDTSGRTVGVATVDATDLRVLDAGLR